MTRPRRFLAVVTVVLAIVVVVGGWAVPTFAGGLLVSVRTHLVPVPGTATAGFAIQLGDGSTSTSSGLRIDLELTNPYPLPVSLDFTGPTFRADLVQDAAGGGRSVWRNTADDPQLEQTDESPGGAGARVMTIPPGTTVVSMTPDGPTLDLASIPGADRVGRYSIVATAYGLRAQPEPLIVTATASDVRREAVSASPT